MIKERVRNKDELEVFKDKERKGRYQNFPIILTFLLRLSCIINQQCIIKIQEELNENNPHSFRCSLTNHSLDNYFSICKEPVLITDLL